MMEPGLIQLLVLRHLQFIHILSFDTINAKFDAGPNIVALQSNIKRVYLTHVKYDV